VAQKHGQSGRAKQISKATAGAPFVDQDATGLVQDGVLRVAEGKGGGGNIKREPKRGRFAGLRRARRTLSVQSSVGSPVAGRPSVDAYGSKMDESDADSTGSETRHRVTGEIVSRPAASIERSRMDQIERHAPAGSELLTSRTPSWRAKSEKAWGIWQQSRRLSWLTTGRRSSDPSRARKRASSGWEKEVRPKEAWARAGNAGSA
jgi:hypothetical protein